MLFDELGWAEDVNRADDAMKARVVQLLSLPQGPKAHAAALITMRTNWFYVHDAQWAGATLLPMIEGENGPEIADATRTGFLSQHNFPADQIYLRLKGLLLSMFVDREAGASHFENLNAIVLASWYRKGDGGKRLLLSADLREALVTTGEERRLRVAGPFTVESLSPHRVPAVDADDSLFDELEAAEGRREKDGSGETVDFPEMVLENLRRSGVQQAHKADRLVFASLVPWPGKWICAEGQVRQASLDEAEDGETGAAPTRRAAILIGPEYGTVSRPDLTAAAREAMEAGFDLLIVAAFNFDAHASEFDRMGALTVLQLSSIQQ